MVLRYDRVLNHLHVGTKVVAAYLNARKRQHIFNQFNEESDEVLILVIMYGVSAVGVNLDRCCCRVVDIKISDEDHDDRGGRTK